MVNSNFVKVCETKYDKQCKTEYVKECHQEQEQVNFPASLRNLLISAG